MFAFSLSVHHDKSKLWTNFDKIDNSGGGGGLCNSSNWLDFGDKNS